jgi:osmotically-inducible protein OsmY
VAPPAVALPPTSTSPNVRVYPGPEPPVVTAPPVTTGTVYQETTTVSRNDLALAEGIRQMLLTDNLLAGISRDVDFAVENGDVTLRGKVATTQDREEVERRVRRLAGVDRVDNRLAVDLNR